MSWLGLTGKTILVVGVANKKSVAYHVGQRLLEVGLDERAHLLELGEDQAAVALREGLLDHLGEEVELVGSVGEG